MYVRVRWIKNKNMSEIIFITGGVRSGKSSFAQEMTEKKSVAPVYLATAHVWDEDFRKRIERHQADRGKQWTTIEEEINISQLHLDGKTILLDCITLWLTNIFYKNNYDIDKSLAFAKEEWERFIKKDICLVVVSNEIGMGIHAENEIARKFADLQGWVNQFIAARSTNVYFLVSGIPMKIK